MLAIFIHYTLNEYYNNKKAPLKNIMNIVLFEPEIPPNTGNVIRLCANTGSKLHLIKPLGFELDNKKLRRAGLDYREFSAISTHENFQAFINAIKPNRIFGLSTKGERKYTEVAFTDEDTFVFGPETRGLPETIRFAIGEENILKIPMSKDSRSINLSNSVAIVLFEALRQTKFSSL